MQLYQFIYLFHFLALASCRFASVENDDGSYSIGLNSDSRGETANSVLALLTKASGYTLDGDYENSPPASESQKPSPVPEFFPVESRAGLLEPHLEILQLIETFIRFKGEVGARLYSLLTDNYDLIRSVYETVLSKIGTLHTFTLVGIKILRKILEFAVSLMVQWQVSLPNLNLDLSFGSGVNSGRKESLDDHFSNNFYRM